MEAGYMLETTTRTLLCGDLFAQPGTEPPPITESDALVWEPSEAFRQEFPYAPIDNAAALLDKLAATEPQVLARCFESARSAWLPEQGSSPVHHLRAPRESRPRP
jgi:hypothetical protein